MAKRLTVPKGTLGNWVAAAKGSNGAAGPGARSAKELETENAKLRKELAEARRERYILKEIKQKSHGRDLKPANTFVECI